MSIELGDTLIMVSDGIRQNVTAVSNENDGLVVIKNKGTFSQCPISNLREPWVLTDPTGKGLETGGPIVLKPDDQTCEDPKQARLFGDERDAEAYRDSKRGIPYFVPKKLKDLLGS